jgi:hypothetical protein
MEDPKEKTNKNRKMCEFPNNRPKMNITVQKYKQIVRNETNKYIGPLNKAA